MQVPPPPPPPPDYCIGHCSSGNCKRKGGSWGVRGSRADDLFYVKFPWKSGYVTPTTEGRDRLNLVSTRSRLYVCTRTRGQKTESSFKNFFTFVAPSDIHLPAPVPSVAPHIAGRDRLYRVGWPSSDSGELTVSSFGQLAEARAAAKLAHPRACVHYHVQPNSPLFAIIHTKMQLQRDTWAKAEIPLSHEDMSIVMVDLLPKNARTGDGSKVEHSAGAWEVPPHGGTTYFIRAKDTFKIEDIMAVVSWCPKKPPYLNSVVRRFRRPCA